MIKDEVWKAIKEKRLAKKVTIADVTKVVGKNPTFTAAVLQGNLKFTVEEAKKVGQFLGLDSEFTAALSKFPVCADFPNTTDPFKCRLLEVIGAYGDSLREQANELFGDGMMSAIDFTLDMERLRAVRERQGARLP